VVLVLEAEVVEVVEGLDKAKNGETGLLFTIGI
jgi:hypothetical protein